MFKDKKKLVMFVVIAAIILLLPFACSRLKECSRSGMVNPMAGSAWVELNCVF